LGKDGKGYIWLKKTPTHTELVPRDEDASLLIKQPDAPEPPPEEQYISDLEKFKHEAEDTMRRAIKEKHSHENVTLELNALKFAYPDANWVDCSEAIFSVMLMSISEGKEDMALKDMITEVVQMIKTWAPLWTKIGLTKEDQIDFIFKIQEFCELLGNDKWGKIFQQLLQNLYDFEVLEEDAILGWAAEQGEAEEEEQKYYKQCTQLLQWLAEASEESEGGSEEEVEEDA